MKEIKCVVVGDGEIGLYKMILFFFIFFKLTIKK